MEREKFTGGKTFSAVRAVTGQCKSRNKDNDCGDFFGEWDVIFADVQIFITGHRAGTSTG